MSDNYNRDQYAQSGNPYYSPPPRDSYTSSANHGGRDGYGAQSQYAHQSGYETYRPPTDEGYRASPASPNMQVTQYDDRRRSNSHSSRNRDRYENDSEDRYGQRQSYGGYLDAPNAGSRPGSRGSHKEKRGTDREFEAKSIGATILGGVAGALIGRKAGNKDILPTVIGGVAGAWGGHKLEGEIDKKRSRSRRRSGAYEQGHEGRGRRNSDDDDKRSFSEKVKDRVRSLSRRGGDRDRDRKGSTSRRRHNSDSEDSDYDDRHRRGAGGAARRSRHEDDGKERYDERYDRY